MFIGNILNTTLQLLKLNWTAFLLRHIHFLSWWLIDFHRQNDSSKLKSVFKIPRFGATTKVSLSWLGVPFFNPVHPKLVYPMKTRRPLCVFWYSCFIPRPNFLVSYSSDPSPGIFFICKLKSVESLILGAKIDIVNCLFARCLHPQMKIQNCFPKAQLQYRH